VLGGALYRFFINSASIFRDLRAGFFDAQDVIDDIDFQLTDFLTWDGIYDAIRSTWAYLDDIRNEIWYTAYDLIRDQYSEITDFWGNVAIGVGDIITDQYSEITDFWGNVAIGVGDWFTASFPDWMEDRAEDVIELAGRILDKVWE